MSFTWPLALLLALAAPAIIVAHYWQLRQRRRSAVRVANIDVIRSAVPRSSWVRRHLPVALLAAATASLAIAAARPTADVDVPISQTTVLLALDTSSSMCISDVDPNRLSVAQDAARDFVTGNEGQIGIVAFNGFAGLVVPPTTDSDELVEAIDRLTVARGTAIGSAIIASLDSIAEGNTDVESTAIDLSDEPVIDPDDTQYASDIIVLLTDGANSRGVEPLVAAELAVQRGVRVYPIGFGSSDPVAAVCTPEQLGSAVFERGGGLGGGGGGGGGLEGIPRRFFDLDEPTLTAVADMTGGEYFRAEDADQLLDVFRDLPTRVETQTESIELSVWFALAGAFACAAAVALSLSWNRSP